MSQIEHIGDQNNAFLVRSVLTPEECDYWINTTESKGYIRNAPVTTAVGFIQRPDIRNNARLIMDREDLAQSLWARLSVYFETFGALFPIGLNERFRFYRYSPQQFFAPHYDGAFTRIQGGMMLAFTHRQLHAGESLVSGLKYVMRTDVMFRMDS